MIKPTTYIRNYSSYWNELLPGSHRFIKDLNINANKSDKRESKLNIQDRAEYRYLISDFSYLLFIRIVEDDVLTDYLTKMNKRHKIFKDIRSIVVPSNLDIQFSQTEVKIIKKLAARIYLKYYSKAKLVTGPKLMGCGLISEGQGDISYGDTLVELKTGERNFGIGDIRQLLIYCTLRHSNNPSKAFKFVELYNPRMGLFWRSSVENLVLEIAGCSSSELFNEIISHISDTERAL